MLPVRPDFLSSVHLLLCVNPGRMPEGHVRHALIESKVNLALVDQGSGFLRKCIVQCLMSGDARGYRLAAA